MLGLFGRRNWPFVYYCEPLWPCSSPAVGSLTFTSPTDHHDDHHDDDDGGGGGGLEVHDSVKCISWNLSIGWALGSIDFPEEASAVLFSHS